MIETYFFWIAFIFAACALAVVTYISIDGGRLMFPSMDRWSRKGGWFFAIFVVLAGFFVFLGLNSRCLA